MMGDPPVTLKSLDFEWGDAYIISYARDQWAALRRDTRRFLTAGTLDELAASIETDYTASPVPRDFDPPGTADYLDEDAVPGQDGERLELLAGLPGRVPALGHQLLTLSPRLDRPQRRRDHLPEHARADVLRADADRAEGTPGPARPPLGLAPWGQRGPLIDPGPRRAWLPHASPCMRYHPAMAADTPARAGPHHTTPGPDIPRATANPHPARRPGLLRVIRREKLRHSP